FSQYVVPGRILDIGSATGQTIKLLTEIKRLEESDFYGVEAARPLYAICQQRKENGAFGSANVFFYQRNIMQSALFPKNSVNTAITMALTHEVESYMGREALLDFIQRVYDMTVPGGVYINYDVAGPDKKNERVYVQFTEDDGENPEDVFTDLDDNELKVFLDRLSSKSRFLRFAKDFRSSEGDTMTYTTETVGDTDYFVMRYGDLCDYLAKKDYTENWHSEMHERFCYWEYEDWIKAITDVGFEIEPASRRITNDWLIENRFTPAASVFIKTEDQKLVAVDSPVTNLLLVARKPEA
ncbi:transferase, partial [Candidatus Saccharibacteria bacterium]|nr:transferase [Candidatus Saccharibacteria bacterium]